MLGRERMRAVFAGEQPDRTPVQYQFFGGAHQVLDRARQSMADAYSSAPAIASTQVAASEMFGHDTAMSPWGCLTVEAEAFGCELDYYEMWYPQVRSRPLMDSTDFRRLHLFGTGLAGRMPLVVDSLTELRSRADDDLFIIAMVVSPFLVACELRDMSQLMLDIGINPQFVTNLLEVVTDGICHYVSAIGESGAADAIMFENAAMAAELLGPHHVESFIRPHHQRLLEHARTTASDTLLIEHNCARTPYFGEIHSSGVDAISFASPDIPTPGGMQSAPVAIGMVDHSELMLKGTPDEVRAAALDCIRQAGDQPFVLSTGCEIPFRAPTENIVALSSAARTG